MDDWEIFFAEKSRRRSRGARRRELGRTLIAAAAISVLIAVLWVMAMQLMEMPVTR